MLSKPTPELLRSLLWVTQQPAWRSVDKALRDELQTLYEKMRDTHDTVNLHQLQGRAQDLSELLKLIGESRELLDKLTKGKM